MKQAKNAGKIPAEKSAEFAAKQVNLREKLIQLTKLEQEAVTNYFNLYNAAAWHYNEVLSANAREFVDESIAYQREVYMLDQAMPGDDVKEGVEFVDRFESAQEALENAGKIKK